MSDTTKNAQRLIGGILDSGSPQTGEIRITDGGEQTFTANSGINVATVLFSGAGRLE